MLHPLEPLNLPDRERVSVTVETANDEDWLHRDAMALAEAEGDATISLEKVRQSLASIPGALADTVIANRGEY